MAGTDLVQKKSAARGTRRRLVLALFALVFTGTPALAADSGRLPTVPKRERFEQRFRSSKAYKHPLQQAALTVAFVSPGGETNLAPGFWDGGRTWRVRFAPDQVGRWTYRTACSDPENRGLADQSGAFLCTAATGTNRLRRHGPLRITSDGRGFEHADRTPFFWLADTAWQGGRASELKAWRTYAGIRAAQQFSAVQWIAVAAGPGQKQPAFTGSERIAVNPDYFQQLDAKVDALNEAGLVSVIAPLWEVDATAEDLLPDDQAALLLRYQAARWGANQIAWLAAFDGGSVPQNIGRWKRLGRATFGEGPHAPVILFPGDTPWVLDELRDETWVDAFGFGISQAFDDDSIKWLVSGPLAGEWKKEPARPLLLVSPLLENSLAPGDRRITADEVRRAAWWSLLLAPPAGVSYGAEAVANWDTTIEKQKAAPRGNKIAEAATLQSAIGNRQSAILPGRLPRWHQSLFLPGARQMGRLPEFLASLDRAPLVPNPRAVAAQPGQESPRRTISAAVTEANDLSLIYVPEERTVALHRSALPLSPVALWTSPVTGETHSGVAVVTGKSCQFPSPAPGDWLLTIRTGQ